MSRSQMGNVYGTAGKTQQQFSQLANTSYANAQNDINAYGSDLAQFKANNPYEQGGSVQTAQNQELSDTAAAGAQTAGNALQSQAVRTGQNAGGAIAATKDIAANNERALAGQEAGATMERAGGNVAYGQAGLQGTQNVQGMQDAMAAQESGAAQAALNTEQQAALMPSFLDQVGSGAAGAIGKGLGAMAVG
jgi:hypothetical protein